MPDSNTPKSQRSAAAADAEKQSAAKTQAELEKLDDLDLDGIAGGATKKSTLVLAPNPGATVSKKGTTAINTTTINTNTAKK